MHLYCKQKEVAKEIQTTLDSRYADEKNAAARAGKTFDNWKPWAVKNQIKAAVWRRLPKEQKEEWTTRASRQPGEDWMDE
jgi:hypothetical protein